MLTFVNCTFRSEIWKLWRSESITVYEDHLSFFFALYVCKRIKGTVHVHSSKSASVLVLRATGRLVLSLVMANSCMPSSSATLACVRLFTSELRSSCGAKRAAHVRIELEVRTRSRRSTSNRRTLTRGRYRSTAKHQNKAPRGIIHQRQNGNAE